VQSADRWRDDSGSILVETALAVAVILTVALPFASLVGYATATSRDIAATHAAARDAARGGPLSAPGVTYECGATVDPAGPCVTPLARGTYVATLKDTPVGMPFGISLGTSAKAVARVE
jgi:Flp pilus assembly protein TadG